MSAIERVFHDTGLLSELANYVCTHVLDATCSSIKETRSSVASCEISEEYALEYLLNSSFRARILRRMRQASQQLSLTVDFPEDEEVDAGIIHTLKNLKCLSITAVGESAETLVPELGPNVETLNLGECTLESLSGFPNLSNLHINDSCVNLEGLSAVKALRTMSLENVTVVGDMELATQSLGTLFTLGLYETNARLCDFRSLPCLMSLSVVSAPAGSLMNVGKICPKISGFEIFDSSVTREELESLVACHKLTKIKLDSTTDLSLFPSLPNIRHLDIEVTSNGLTSWSLIAEKFPFLTHLVVSVNSHFAPLIPTQQLVGLKELQKLTLAGFIWGVESLATLPNLQVIDFSAARVQTHLTPLRAAPKLTTVVVCSDTTVAEILDEVKDWDALKLTKQQRPLPRMVGFLFLCCVIIFFTSVGLYCVYDSYSTARYESLVQYDSLRLVQYESMCHRQSVVCV